MAVRSLFKQELTIMIYGFFYKLNKQLKCFEFVLFVRMYKLVKEILYLFNVGLKCDDSNKNNVVNKASVLKYLYIILLQEDRLWHQLHARYRNISIRDLKC